MRISSVLDVKCFCNNKNVLCVQSKVGEFLLLFGVESFIFQVAIQKVKDQDI